MTIPVRRSAGAAAFFVFMGWAGMASAGSVESTVKHDQPAQIFSVMTFGKNDCASYPVAELKITVHPTHGRAAFVRKRVKLGDEAGVCKGTAFDAPWLVYDPEPGYVGTDTVSISWKWTLYDNGTAMKYATRDFAITVK